MPLRKRSVRIAGHTTSISLEDEFWSEICAIAHRRGVPVASLICEIDAARQGNLSSALRVFVLQQLKADLARLNE